MRLIFLLLGPARTRNAYEIGNTIAKIVKPKFLEMNDGGQGKATLRQIIITANRHFLLLISFGCTISFFHAYSVLSHGLLLTAGTCYYYYGVLRILLLNFGLRNPSSSRTLACGPITRRTDSRERSTFVVSFCVSNQSLRRQTQVIFRVRSIRLCCFSNCYVAHSTICWEASQVPRVSRPSHGNNF